MSALEVHRLFRARKTRLMFFAA